MEVSYIQSPILETEIDEDWQVDIFLLRAKIDEGLHFSGSGTWAFPCNFLR